MVELTKKELAAIQEAKDTMSARKFKNAIKEVLETPIKATTDSMEARKLKNKLETLGSAKAGKGVTSFKELMKKEKEKEFMTTTNREERKRREEAKRSAMAGKGVATAKGGETTQSRISEEDRKLVKKALPNVKGGGLMEATAKLKAKGLKEGGMVVKDKTVAIDKSPNSGLITVKGFGAGRRT